MPGGTSINWNENSPADTDGAGSGDDEIRSLKSSLRQGLSSEHAWPSGGGLSGYHTYGSARPYVGAQSLVSSDGTDGRLMLTSDSSNLFALQSTGTVFVGGPRTISAGSYPGATPQRHYWAEEFGIGTTISSITAITFPNSGFSGAPFVFLTGYGANTNILPVVRAVSATVLQVETWLGDTVTVNNTEFFWRSIGTRVL